GNEQGGAGGRARNTTAASRLSHGRSNLSRTSRISHCCRTRFQDRCNDAAGCPLQSPPRLLDRAPTYLGQRRISATTISEGVDVRRRHRLLEPVPPRQRGVGLWALFFYKLRGSAASRYEPDA